MKWKEGTKSSVEEYLRYDLAGNITDIARENARYQLGYDAADQLVSSKMKGMQGVPDFNRQFGYDLVGNRVNDSENGLGNFEANFLKANNGSGFEADPYGFGAVAKETTANNVKNYSYRADGKIATFSDKTTQASYFYDGLDRLTAKALNVNGIQFTQSYVNLADEDRVLLGKAGDGSVTSYVDGPDLGDHLGEVRGGLGKGYITDHIGSVLSSPLATSARTFGPFGEVTRHFEINPTSSPVNYGWQGLSHSVESGLWNNLARQYDQNTGTFTSQDPIGHRGGTNFYESRKNNPLSIFDILGLYGTNSCEYYTKRCQESGGKYYCETAQWWCNHFPKQPDPDPKNTDPDKNEGWPRCTRQCLQDCDAMVTSSCPKAPASQQGTDSFWNEKNFQCHAACYTTCASSNFVK